MEINWGEHLSERPSYEEAEYDTEGANTSRATNNNILKNVD